MATVSAEITVPYAISAAEELWYRTDRWSGFVDGLAVVESIEGDWPRVGARLVWEGKPQGRGRVTETVTAYEPRVTCVTAVEDEKLQGTQTIAFTPHQDGAKLRLSLTYVIKDRNPFTPLVDLFFVRRVQRESLQRTLLRFALELRDEIDPPV